MKGLHVFYYQEYFHSIRNVCSYAILHTCYKDQNELGISMETKRIKKNTRNIKRKADNPIYRRPLYYKKSRISGYAVRKAVENLPTKEYNPLEKSIVSQIVQYHDRREEIKIETMTQSRS